MGSPTIPKPLVAPPPANTTKAQIDALAFAETQRRLMKSQGRAGSFVTKGQPQLGTTPRINTPLTSVLGG